MPPDHQGKAGRREIVKIYFCGMIGSGKTTIGRILSRDFGVDFYDLDQEMDRILGHSFHRLVEEKGWVAFRELEYSICKRFAGMEQGVICLGGGTVRYEWNMDVLAGTGLFILLTAPLPVLAERGETGGPPPGQSRPDPGRRPVSDLGGFKRQIPGSRGYCP